MVICMIRKKKGISKQIKRITFRFQIIFLLYYFIREKNIIYNSSAALISHECIYY